MKLFPFLFLLMSSMTDASSTSELFMAGIGEFGNGYLQADFKHVFLLQMQKQKLINSCVHHCH